MPPISHPGIQVRQGPRGTVYRARVRHGERQGGAVLTRSFTSLAAALAWRAQTLAAVRDGTELPSPPPPPTPRRPMRLASVEDAAVALCRGMVAGTVRSRTGVPFKPSVARKYETALRLFVLPRIGGLPLADLRRGDVQRLVDALAAERSAETARKALTALRVALRVAEHDGLIETQPCAGVRVPVDADGERPVRVLTPEECSAIVAAGVADDARFGRSLAGPLFALAFGSGLRSGEIMALPWGPGGLDLDTGHVRVRRSLDRVRDDSGAYPVVTPKSRAGWRDVPLAPADVAMLRRHRLASGRPPDGALVFSEPSGAPLNATGVVRGAWRRAVAATGIEAPAPRFHDARHAWAVAMLRAGVRPEAVAKLGGWSDVGMVTRRYGRHALPDELAGAGHALERFRAQRAVSAGRVRAE